MKDVILSSYCIIASHFFSINGIFHGIFFHLRVIERGWHSGVLVSTTASHVCDLGFSPHHSMWGWVHVCVIVGLLLGTPGPPTVQKYAAVN